jgi:Copper type II ascorbate-dependent monooxygenase, C-terminal domain/Copper type II ascorbate-dependent monooxygenase, N-terminal domain
MSRRDPVRSVLLGLSCVALAAACGAATTGASPDGGGAGSPLPDGGAAARALPCDVDAVLAARCRSCHDGTPLYGAPMPMVTWDDLHAASKSDPSAPVYQRVHARVHDDALPMPPPPNARLDAADLATLDAWVQAGAPAGASACTAKDGGVVTTPDGAPPPSTCVPDLHIAPTSPYKMATGEEYACYGFDVPAGTRHVTQIRVHVDNPKIVHHILLLRAPGTTSGTPLPCNPGPSLAAQMLYAWSPGGLPLVLPADAGFRQDSTTHYQVQVHYNNAANAPNPTDATGFDLCTTSTLRKYDADVVAFGTQAISLPPHATTDLKSCYTVPDAFDGRRFFASFPHMHQLGKSISTVLLPGGSGAPVDMGTDSAWDFKNQPWVTFDALLHKGDVVKTDCTWNNSTSAGVVFGQNSENEMCYSFSAYYPAASSIGWATPATFSSLCQ